MHPSEISNKHGHKKAGTPTIITIIGLNGTPLVYNVELSKASCLAGCSPDPRNLCSMVQINMSGIYISRTSNEKKKKTPNFPEPPIMSDESN